MTGHSEERSLRRSNLATCNEISILIGSLLRRKRSRWLCPAGLLQHSKRRKENHFSLRLFFFMSFSFFRRATRSSMTGDWSKEAIRFSASAQYSGEIS